MTPPPLRHLREDGRQRQGQRRERVLDGRRPPAVLRARQQAVFFQLAQRPHQHAAVETGQLPQKTVEPIRARPHQPQHVGLPAPHEKRGRPYSPVAVVPAGAEWVLIGGQNAVDEQGQVVGGDDVGAQARQVLVNLQAALTAAGCGWNQVVRMTVHLKEGVDPRLAFGVFAPALATRTAPPLVGVSVVRALARPEFLLEVGLEAVR